MFDTGGIIHLFSIKDFFSKCDQILSFCAVSFITVIQNGSSVENLYKNVGTKQLRKLP